MSSIILPFPRSRSVSKVQYQHDRLWQWFWWWAHLLSVFSAKLKSPIESCPLDPSLGQKTASDECLMWVETEQLQPDRCCCWDWAHLVVKPTEDYMTMSRSTYWYLSTKCLTQASYPGHAWVISKMNHQDCLPETTRIFVDLGGFPIFWRSVGDTWICWKQNRYADFLVHTFSVVDSLKLLNEKIRFFGTSFTIFSGELWRCFCNYEVVFVGGLAAGIFLCIIPLSGLDGWCKPMSRHV